VAVREGQCAKNCRDDEGDIVSTDTPIENLSAALAHAQYAGFPEIIYQDRDWEHFQNTKEDRRIEKRRRPGIRDITVAGMFTQMWGSTALGFGGIGGAAMTTAYTIILECEGRYAVYFGGRFAYLIERPNETFFEDMVRQQMEKVADANKYKKAKENA